MGIDTIAIVEQRLSPEQLLQLPARLNDESTAALRSAVDDLYGLLYSNASDLQRAYGQGWRLAGRLNTPDAVKSYWAQGKAIFLSNEAGIYLTIGRHLCSIFVGVRWGSFRDTPMVADRVCEIGSAVGLALHAVDRQVVCVPDGGLSAAGVLDQLYEDGTLTDVVRWLTGHRDYRLMSPVSE